MRRKRANCRNCGKAMRSDNIQRHMNVCTKDRGLGTDKVQEKIQQKYLVENSADDADSENSADDNDTEPSPPTIEHSKTVERG
jgi:hypothetical protein